VLLNWHEFHFLYILAFAEYTQTGDVALLPSSGKKYKAYKTLHNLVQCYTPAPFNEGNNAGFVSTAVRVQTQAEK
jgi:hypothetical protein